MAKSKPKSKPALTAEHRIKRELILQVQAGCTGPEDGALFNGAPVMETADQIDEAWGKLAEEGFYSDWFHDAMSDFRDGEFKTGLPSQSSRHYEAEEVGAALQDGTFVGWTFWYGGGKHSNPDEIDWMSEAYDLEVSQKEKMVVVKTFTRIDNGESSEVADV